MGSSFKNITKVLNNYADLDTRPILETVGDKLLSDLKSGTPVDSGETMSSWAKSIEKDGDGYALVVTNSAHPDVGIPMPLLIKYGHGTGSGGYVPPNDFITEPFNQAVRLLDAMIEEEVD